MNVIWNSVRSCQPGMWSLPQATYLGHQGIMRTGMARMASRTSHDRLYIDGLVQERRNSSALAMGLCLSCINPSTRHEFQDRLHIDGLVQERPNSIANALELHLSCINPSTRYAFPPGLTTLTTCDHAILNAGYFVWSILYPAWSLDHSCHNGMLQAISI